MTRYSELQVQNKFLREKDSSSQSKNREILINSFYTQSDRFPLDSPAIPEKKVDFVVWNISRKSLGDRTVLILTRLKINGNFQYSSDRKFFEIDDINQTDIVPHDVVKAITNHYFEATDADPLETTIKIEPILGSKSEDIFLTNDDGPLLEPLVYGYILMGHNYSSKEARELHLEIRHFNLASNYARSTAQGRYSRKLRAISMTQKILDSTSSVEKKINKFKKLLAEVIFMKEVHHVTFQGDASGIVFPDNTKRPTLLSLGINSNHDTNLDSTSYEKEITYDDLCEGNVICQNKVSFSVNNEIKIRDHDNFLIMPLHEKAFKIDNNEMLDLKSAFKTKFKGAIVNHAFILSEKIGERYLPKTVSDTDIEICELLAKSFQIGLSRDLYDRKLTMFLEEITKEELSRDITAKEIYELVATKYFKCSGVYEFTVSPASDGKHKVVSSEYFGGETILGKEGRQAYIKKMTLCLSKKSFCDKISEAPICVGFDSRKRIEVSFSSDVAKLRLVVFELDTNIISETDTRVLRYLISELKILLTTMDSLNARYSEIAQIRHAITVPLNSARLSIKNVNKFVDLRSNNPPDVSEEIQKKYDAAWLNLRESGLFADLKMGERQARYAHILAENGKYLFLNNENLSLEKRSFDLNHLLSDILYAMRPIADNENIKIVSFTRGNQNNSSGHKKVPHADDALLYLVYTNILENAVKYTLKQYSIEYYGREQSGRFRDRKLPHNYPIVEVELVYLESTYHLIVRNVGKYLSEEDIERIKEPFSRGGFFSGVTPKTGTGIGLPASIKVLEGHYDEARLNITSDDLQVTDGAALNTITCVMPYQGLRRNENK